VTLDLAEKSKWMKIKIINEKECISGKSCDFSLYCAYYDITSKFMGLLITLYKVSCLF
jgi:hypothetical protein